ncbi:MAG: T9SS type A sorting domain-containing protein [Chitinophagaceae bacterium]|nr:T9SS type A sorting domain-containing protein [Chitinophagaceae bacterium]
MIPFFLKSIILSFFFFISFNSFGQTTNTYTTSTTWVVPLTVTSIVIKVHGGGGGTGGQDCGAGCSNSAAGQTGYVNASFAVTPGDVIGIYPGGKGVNGGNSVSGTGGGIGGADTYPSLNFNGGTGGNAGSSGSSGGGGGGGAASVVTINSVIRIVAGGAAGGGGMANMAGSGLPGNSTTSSNGLNNGGNGTTPGGDGGGGGASGGGQFASVGGGVHAAGGESAGNGGFRGANAITTASLVTTNGTIAWANGGQIAITFLSTLPVQLLDFKASKQIRNVVLTWSTASEQNAKDFIIQRSKNGQQWDDIGSVTAIGNSTTRQDYEFTDQNPLSNSNYYRLQQRDQDHNFLFSKIVVLQNSGIVGNLFVYPNPVINGMMTVWLQEASEIAIYNVSGARMMQQKFTAGKHLVNLSHLPKGNYYIRSGGEGIKILLQ